MKTAEIREASTENIQSYLDDARENYFKLRFRFTTGQLSDHSQLKIARKEIAKIATICVNESLKSRAKEVKNDQYATPFSWCGHTH